MHRVIGGVVGNLYVGNTVLLFKNCLSKLTNLFDWTILHNILVRTILSQLTHLNVFFQKSEQFWVAEKLQRGRGAKAARPPL